MENFYEYLKRYLISDRTGMDYAAYGSSLHKSTNMSFS